MIDTYDLAQAIILVTLFHACIYSLYLMYMLYTLVERVNERSLYKVPVEFIFLHDDVAYRIYPSVLYRIGLVKSTS